MLSKLVQQGHLVQPVTTHGSEAFIGSATLEGLTGKLPLKEVFHPGKQMDHIHLADWADGLILCPASAHTLNQLAQGYGGDLLGALSLAWNWELPFLVVPAMNTRMWEHPATQKSVGTLQSWGARLLPPQSGRLACGAQGKGKLPETEEILSFIHSPWSPSQRNVLITCGGTREPIDGVRSIVNTSTGKTGLSLARKLNQAGWKVTLIHSKETPVQREPFSCMRFQTYEELEEALKKTLGNHSFQQVIHCAAVSDFAVDSLWIEGKELSLDDRGKLPSSSPPVITMKKREKMLDRLKDWSCNPHLQVTAFKLTHHASEEEKQHAVHTLFTRASVDQVVHNDLQSIEANCHSFTFFHKKGAAVPCPNLTQLAETLVRLS